jgi:hypothetical protein
MKFSTISRIVFCSVSTLTLWIVKTSYFNLDATEDRFNSKFQHQISREKYSNHSDDKELKLSARKDKKNIIIASTFVPKIDHLIIKTLYQSIDKENKTTFLRQDYDKKSSQIKTRSDISFQNVSLKTTILLSLNKSAISDVRGNLGPPSVITQETVQNWLADRWQGRMT